MKNILFLLVLLITFSNYAQTDKFNEVRLNAFSLIASRTVDLTYERVLNFESSVGLSVAFDVTGGKVYNLFNINQSYAITPYYRYHMPKHIANGLFVEAFLSANGGKIIKDRLDEDIQDIIEDEGIDIEDDPDNVAFEYGDFAFGVGGGYKYISEGGFVGEIYGGAGRNLSGDVKSPVILPRLGISFGFRF